jgi:DNA-binding NarL/FixJ family response regulator
MGWKIFYDSAPESRLYSRISYDFYLHHKNGAKTLVNQKLSPLLLSEDDNIWVGICIVNHSPNKSAGNVVFSQNDKNLNYTYDFKKKRVISYVPDSLTKREEEILILSMRGYSEESIADQLNLSVKTVKNHRQNVRQKLGVNNLTNAVSKFNLRF